MNCVLLILATVGPRCVEPQLAPYLLPDTVPAVTAAAVGETVVRLTTWKPHALRLLDTTVIAYGLSPDDQGRRHRAVEHSDFYYTRLTIHRIGSYTMLPLFGAEYYVGQRLYTGVNVPRSSPATRWNLWDSRHETEGRTKRLVHSALMLAADAGFAYTASIAHGARRNPSRATQHRTAALVSMGISTGGALLMWFWK